MSNAKYESEIIVYIVKSTYKRLENRIEMHILLWKPKTITTRKSLNRNQF